MTIRVMIADDQALIRDAFAVLLDSQPDMAVVATAVDGNDAVAQVARCSVDVIVMDIRMPDLNGIEATRRIVGAGARAPKVLILTTFDLDEYVYEALRAGASGFLLKEASGVELSEAVRVVAAGDALLSPAMTRRLIAEFSRLSAAAPVVERPAVHGLTGRETDVVIAVSRGLSNRETAAELFVTEQTVKTHVSNVLHKLQLRDRTQIAVYAYESGLVRPGGAEL
ncbi:LuxR family transcriptional regulator [Tsukamurella pulmonis]|uniref:response regulator transcription factor n=1 Tax=Tsukamurella pulmonis TaxID=47312 RepID=UPI0007965C9D|nr:response regulator transcription factor [Tsukamurella pulmonis]KXP08099.1 LuxR family transcriptional regulator [Tsukamurella pulmonis]RDH11021.1 DNA-binding response regulator [Tsukamurella pulmonis]